MNTAEDLRNTYALPSHITIIKSGSTTYKKMEKCIIWKQFYLKEWTCNQYHYEMEYYVGNQISLGRKITINRNVMVIE